MDSRANLAQTLLDNQATAVLWLDVGCAWDISTRRRDFAAVGCPQGAGQPRESLPAGSRRVRGGLEPRRRTTGDLHPTGTQNCPAVPPRLVAA